MVDAHLGDALVFRVHVTAPRCNALRCADDDSARIGLYGAGPLPARTRRHTLKPRRYLDARERTIVTGEDPYPRPILIAVWACHCQSVTRWQLQPAPRVLRNLATDRRCLGQNMRVAHEQHGNTLEVCLGLDVMACPDPHLVHRSGRGGSCSLMT
jgi:hypothetical protein